MSKYRGTGCQNIEVQGVKMTTSIIIHNSEGGVCCLEKIPTRRRYFGQNMDFQLHLFKKY